VVQFFHFFDLVVVATKHVFVLGTKLNLDPFAGLNVFELIKQVEGALRRAELVLEGVIDELDNV
jgi:hypothetical protein